MYTFSAKDSLACQNITDITRSGQLSLEIVTPSQPLFQVGSPSTALIVDDDVEPTVVTEGEKEGEGEREKVVEEWTGEGEGEGESGGWTGRGRGRGRGRGKVVEEEWMVMVSWLFFCSESSIDMLK